MSKDDVPEWAIKRAEELTAQDYYIGDPRAAFARYIAAHEPAPVDPIRQEAIELVLADEVGRTSNQQRAIREGRAGQQKVALAMAAIERGMELARLTNAGTMKGE